MPFIFQCKKTNCISILKFMLNRLITHKNKTKINVKLSVMWPLAFIRKFLPQFSYVSLQYKYFQLLFSNLKEVCHGHFYHRNNRKRLLFNFLNFNILFRNTGFHFFTLNICRYICSGSEFPECQENGRDMTKATTHTGHSNVTLQNATKNSRLHNDCKPT